VLKPEWNTWAIEVRLLVSYWNKNVIIRHAEETLLPFFPAHFKTSYKRQITEEIYDISQRCCVVPAEVRLFLKNNGMLLSVTFPFHPTNGSILRRVNPLIGGWKNTKWIKKITWVPERVFQPSWILFIYKSILKSNKHVLSFNWHFIRRRSFAQKPAAPMTFPSPSMLMLHTEGFPFNIPDDFIVLWTHKDSLTLIATSHLVLRWSNLYILIVYNLTWNNVVLNFGTTF